MNNDIRQFDTLTLWNANDLLPEDLTHAITVIRSMDNSRVEFGLSSISRHAVKELDSLGCHITCNFTDDTICQ